MKVIIEKTSDWTYREIRKFATLEALIAFKNEIGHAVILRDNIFKQFKFDEIAADSIEEAEKLISCDFILEIYDDYRE